MHDFSCIPVDSSALAYLRWRYGRDRDAFAASGTAWDPYLALGYRLMRLRDKLEPASTSASE